MPKHDSRPAVIDLFSGVGGLSLGAAQAGFRVAASVELDPIASKSHADNFPTTIHLERDVATLTGEQLLDAAGLRTGELSGLIGGPPCQGFSLIGKRHRADPRNELLGHFFRLVAETRPAFYVAENVPGVLSDATRDIVEAALANVPKDYVQLRPLRIEAHRYGAATTRTRVFFIGYDPERTNRMSEDLFAPPDELAPATVGHAFHGLPAMRAAWQHESQSWRRVDECPNNAYAYRVSANIPEGVGNARALERFREQRLVSGFLGTIHSPETVRRFSKLKPGEVDEVYRAPRLKRDGLCPTLRAGTGRDRGSYQAVRPIHPSSPRVINPREAARLQGFPDWFVFHPTKWHSFRQIGNSVCPVVARELLGRIATRVG